MKAIFYEHYGDAGVLQYGERETPRAGKNEVLVRVLACSVNPIDWKLRKGELRPATAFRLPIIPGLDVAGEVTEIGEGVTHFQQGDRIFGLLDGIGGGPCPPANHGKHRYFFRLYALDVESLELPAGSRREQFEEVMRDHVVGQSELMGQFERGATSR